jgi:hypothetical protein
MPVKKYVIENLKVYKEFAKKENRSKIDELIKLYQEQKVPQPTAYKIAKKLAGTKAQVPSGLNLLDAYTEKDSMKGRIGRPSVQLKTYFVSGKVHTKEFYYKRTKMKGQKGVLHHREYNESYPFKKTIRARSIEDAKKKFKEMARDEYDTDEYDKKKEVKDVEIESFGVEDSFEASDQRDQPMRAAKPANYHFIPSDDKYDKNEGMCVFDTFLGLYAVDVNQEINDNKRKIKKLTKESLTELCKQYYWSVDGYKRINPLDYGIDEVEEAVMWKPEDGISANCVDHICRYYNISHYAYDITNKCFMKYIATCRNHDALIYYSVNNHMYYVSDPEAAMSMVRKARDIEVNMSSVVFEKEFEKENVYINKTIYDDIPVEQLGDEQYQDCVIIYDKNDLNEELDKIIELYNVIPSVKNHKYNIVSIKLTPRKGNTNAFLAKNIFMAIDPNETKTVNYKDVQKLCLKHGFEFENQSFGTLVRQMREKFYSAKSIRKEFSKVEREQIHESCGGQCNECHKKIQSKGMHIDHIIPLASGGTNESENLQVLCKKCHFEKSKEEQEQGYVKISETESSFNLKTHEIFNSKLCASYAFVERVNPQKDRDSKIWHFDINKCRANCMYYSKYDFPLFTVMDEPVVFKGDTSRPGLYYIEDTNYGYFPLRGNGWYSQAMIDHCLTRRRIKPTDIKCDLRRSSN